MEGFPRRRFSVHLLFGLFAGAPFAPSAKPQIVQDPTQPPNDVRAPKIGEDDPKLPDGKSQKNAIAKQQHKDALKDAQRLLAEAQSLQKELEDAGEFVIPLGSLKRTEEIERLAKKIRGRLKS